MGRIAAGGQDTASEGQIAFAIPGEDEDVIVNCSTQHPSEAQHMVAHVLGVPSHSVTINVRRMGGGFGGKESQMNIFAVVAAMAAKKLNRPVKICPDRDQDMTATGKRQDFVIECAAFDGDGVIQAVESHLRALRIFLGSLGAGDRPGAVPCRQRLFLSACAADLLPAKDQHRFEHGVSRLAGRRASWSPNA